MTYNFTYFKGESREKNTKHLLVQLMCRGGMASWYLLQSCTLGWELIDTYIESDTPHLCTWPVTLATFGGT